MNIEFRIKHMLSGRGEYICFDNDECIAKLIYSKRRGDRYRLEDIIGRKTNKTFASRNEAKAWLKTHVEKLVEKATE